MKRRQALDVLRRLNELQLTAHRVEAAERRQSVARTAALCERQDGFLGYLGERLQDGRHWSLAGYQAESERFQLALDDRAILMERLSQQETALDESIRACFGLERRNKTLRQVMATRLSESRRVEDQRRLRELDELWSQGRGTS